MAWYLRKAVSVGPIRLNLSKSGVGASVGVTGFRIGMRPDGSSYVHAGRYGLYMREELGGRRGENQAPPLQSVEPAPTQRFDAVSTSDLASPERKELLERLNKSYKDFRLDYLAFLIAAVAGTCQPDSDRSLKINVDSRDLTSAHESKVNAGASSLVSREPAAVGTGTPPWVETNVTVPTLKARGVTAYFMPDCILVYDTNGVGCVEHASLSFSTSAERFIEDGEVPSDSDVVDHTWKYANKVGGPDRRFKDNKEIPICLYGKLDLSTSLGLLCHLQTSKKDAPQCFSKQYSAYLKAIGVGRAAAA